MSKPGPQKNPLYDSRRTLHLPGLNGLRAIAALGVVISHITLSLDKFGLNTKIFGTYNDGTAEGLDLAGDGVTIFFVLSGFLITYLLLKEKEFKQISVKNFYIRRILRIWPLYYLYLVVSLIVAVSFGMAVEKSSIPFYVFLAANVPFLINKTLPFVGHYWSLGVEEQFYLFFPQLAKKSNRTLFRGAVLILVALLFLKIFFWLLQKKYAMELPLLAITITRFHVMLMGVVAAGLYYYENRFFISIATNRIVQWIAWGCFVLIAVNKFHIGSVIDQELVALIAVCLITGQVTKRNRIINLENKACDFVGKISYSLYVIHPLLIFFFVKLLGKLGSNSVRVYIEIYLLITATSILIAYVSYEFFEKRFLRLKEKFSAIKSSDISAAGDQYTLPGMQLANS